MANNFVISKTRIDQPTEKGPQYPIEYFSGYPGEVYFGHPINGLVIEQSDQYQKTVFYTFLEGYDIDRVMNGYFWRVRPATDSLQARLFARSIDDLPF